MDVLVNRTGELARRLGLTSLALGAAMLALPRATCAVSGLPRTPRVIRRMRLVGLRELCAAAGLLAPGSDAPWLWSRVAGDLMDLAMLSAVSRGRQGRLRRRLSIASVSTLTVLDVWAASRTSGSPQPVHNVTMALTINRRPEDVYAFWRRFENLPLFMTHLERVTQNGDLSTWSARGPLGSTVEWTARITDDTPNRRIAWASLPGSPVSTEGVVLFREAPGQRGTELVVTIDYGLPLGRVGSALSTVAGEHPKLQVHDDLKRFKQILEVGEIITSNAAPQGPRSRNRIITLPATTHSSTQTQDTTSGQAPATSAQ